MNQWLFFREEFVYDKGVKNGPAVLYGVSGATRKGQLKQGKWHGEAKYTAQVGLGKLLKRNQILIVKEIVISIILSLKGL